jgi:hypothetical protein
MERTMKKSAQTANYGALLVLGVAFIPIGIATDNIAFNGVAIVFLALGIKGRTEAQ